ncbi:MAG: hypothetical protein QXT94_00460 [Methanothrix sp.]|jgi:membrane protease subunit (stomatin/prohibitin family)
MPKQKGKRIEERAIAKSITISARHQRFVEARSINLSKFVQKKLDEEIEATGWEDKVSI